MKAALPPDEAERLKALQRYEILDTDPEKHFDDITLLASHICETPIAMISLVDENRQWFKSKVGTTESETSRDIAFCAHGILQAEVLVINDARADERFAANPLVTGESQLRFYAGAPLVTPDGHALGMLCVTDQVPRELSPEQRAALQALSRQVVAQLELRRSMTELGQAERALQRAHDGLEIRVQQRTAELVQANEALAREVTVRTRAEEGLQRSQTLARMAGRLSRMGAWSVEVPALKVTFSDEVCAIHEVPPDFAPTVEEAIRFYAPEFREIITEAFGACVRDGTPFDVELQLVTAKGRRVWVRSIGEAQRNAAGAITRVQGAFQDITARKQADLELAQVHTQLLDASRQAGMAEFATGILHNVSNVLNSVNVASSCLADSLRQSKVANLNKVAALLREHEKDLGDFFTNNPKGRQVPVYLAHLAEHLAGEQTGALKELAELQKNIEHIKEIIVMQQGRAKMAGGTVILKVTDLVEDALSVNASALARHDIQIVKEFAETPPLTLEKNKAVQILVNLVRNAQQSCLASGQPEKKLTIRTAAGNGRVQIAVSDNGVGIPPENLARIFTHGFTTKKEGHGFGLHSCALAAKELGGALTVHSAGVGQGATFVLELPFKPGALA